MDAKELRLGNYVRINNREFHPTVSNDIMMVVGIKYNSSKYFPSSRNDVSMLNQDKYDFIQYCQMEEFIDPIPISEDVLLKLGFENWGSGKHYKGIAEYTRFVLHNVIDGTSNFEVHKEIDTDDYIISCDDNERINFGINIRYVHQLQNFFFSICGYDLAYNK